MTPAEAEVLAGWVHAAIDRDPFMAGYDLGKHAVDAHRRVDRDLAGLRECWAHHEGDRPFGLTALMATRFAEDMRDVAALYGVQP